MIFIRAFNATIYLTLITLTCFSLASATTFFVRNGGDDSADGLSDAKAWATIEKVNDYAESTGFSDGDVIQFKRDSIWDRDETLGFDGTAINWGKINGLVIQDYGTGKKPFFNANSFQPIQIYGPNLSNLTIKNIDVSGRDWASPKGTAVFNVLISYARDITVDGIYSDADFGASTDNNASGVKISRPFGNVVIKNCEIFNFVNRPLGATGQDLHCLYIGYNDNGTPKTTGSVSIHDNILHDVEADGIQTAGIYTTMSIYNNTIYNFGENAIDLKIAHNASIYNNHLYRGEYGLGGSGGGKGNIVFHGFGDWWGGRGTVNLTIRGNHISDTPFMGIRVLSPNQNVVIENNHFESCREAIDVTQSENLLISNNTILQDRDYPCIGAECSAIWVWKGHLGSPGLKILGNKIFINNTTTKYGIRFERAANTENVSISNNIIEMTSKSTSAWPLYVDSGNGPLPTIGYNTYHNSNSKNRVSLSGSSFYIDDESKWVSSGHTGELFRDPLFVNPESGNLTLRSDSPVLTSGEESSNQTEEIPMNAPKNLRVLP